jgi:GntR family transcriptional repressor for pyruvate dehydrogenase complex
MKKLREENKWPAAKGPPEPPDRNENGKMKPIEPIRKKILAEEIAERIRTRIFDGTFKPGEKLPPERELARQLRVNRSSLREGLKMLQQLGLVSIRHGDGTRVLDFFQTASIEVVKYLLNDSSLERGKIMSDIMDVRKIICSQVVKLASSAITRHEIEDLRRHADRVRTEAHDEAEIIVLDFEFYERLSRIAGNMILNLMLNTVKPPFKVFRPMFSKLVISSQEVWETQTGILDAIEAKDVDTAVSIAEAYLAKSAQYFLDQIKD